MTKYLLIDGYNIIFSHKKLTKLAEESSLDHARGELINQLTNFSGLTEERIILIFDAHKVNNGIEHVEIKNNITIVYTKEKETADQYIERVSKELTKKYSVRVATSDVTEQIIIIGQGAKPVSAESFELELRAVSQKIKEIIDKKKPIKQNLLIDQLNQEALNFLNQLRLEPTTFESSNNNNKSKNKNNHPVQEAIKPKEMSFKEMLDLTFPDQQTQKVKKRKK